MFDTLSYSEALVNISVPENQAKLQAKVLSTAFESNDLATKADIKIEITELKTQMGEMELRIIKWQIGGIGLIIVVIIKQFS